MLDRRSCARLRGGATEVLAERTSSTGRPSADGDFGHYAKGLGIKLHPMRGELAHV